MNRILFSTLILAAVPALSGQTSAPAFEVASVKLNTSVHSVINNKFGPDSVRWTNTPLRNLIEYSYQLKGYQLLGGPAWIDSDGWDIDARAAHPASMSEKSEMMATLLADRFQLRLHRETRQLPVYRLVVAKGGPKLAPAKEEDAERTTPGAGSLRMTGASMEMLVFFLSGQLNQPIIESTGLTGKYDLKLEWADDSQPASPDASAETPRMSIFAAVEYQLGLKLESTKGPVEVLIIDHVEKPSGN